MSKTIKFCVPSIVFEYHEVEVADDFELDSLAWDEIVDFMYNHLSDSDKEWIGEPVPEKNHKSVIERAMDAGYISIKEIEP